MLYKALAHPLAAERLAVLARALGEAPYALFDPDNIADALCALAPGLARPASVLVQDVEQLGRMRAGVATRPLIEAGRLAERTLLVAAFDADRVVDRLRAIVPDGVAVRSLDEARLPDALLTNGRRYLDRLNFATNFAFFREADGLSTRLVTANYWSSYGAGAEIGRAHV